MIEISLTFEQSDTGLNLTGIVNFPDCVGEQVQMPDSIHIRGLAEWRHVSANVIHLSQEFITRFNMIERGKPLSKIGINWFGLQTRRSDILLSFTTRNGKDGIKKVQTLLTKFFKAIGASSIKFSILDVDRALVDQSQEANEVE